MRQLFFLLMISSSFVVNAQNKPTIDLSKINPDEITINLDANGYKIINKLPSASYKVKISVDEEPFPLNMNSSSEGSSFNANDPCTSELKEYNEAYKNLLEADNEKDVKRFIDSLKLKQKDAIANHKTCYDKLTNKADELINSTQESRIFDFSLKKNQTITMTIFRINEEGNILKTWTVILRTPRTVNYITHFGFTFNSNIIKPSDQYFSKQDTGNTYLITKFHDNGKKFWEDLSLTANFIFPIKYRKTPNADLHFSWVAGFGVSGGGKFSIFTGPGFLLSDFFAGHLAFGLYNEKKLKGELEPGQRIKENLNFDQLHNSGPRPTIILSFSFRLSKNQLEPSSTQ